MLQTLQLRRVTCLHPWGHPAAGFNPPPDTPPVSYSVLGSPTYITFGVFSALGTIAFGFGDTILPEVQVGLPASVRGLECYCCRRKHL